MTGDLISRQAVLRELSSRLSIVDMIRVAEIVESVPAVDAEPVVHAHWEEAKAEGIKTGYFCSSCGEFAAWILKRCPECGAHMDEEV